MVYKHFDALTNFLSNTLLDDKLIDRFPQFVTNIQGRKKCLLCHNLLPIYEEEKNVYRGILAMIGNIMLLDSFLHPFLLSNLVYNNNINLK